MDEKSKLCRKPGIGRFELEKKLNARSPLSAESKFIHARKAMHMP